MALLDFLEACNKDFIIYSKIEGSGNFAGEWSGPKRNLKCRKD